MSLEIRNKQKGPIQVLVRSKKHPRAFTTLNIPGIGSGNNIKTIDDELVTEYIKRVEEMNLIQTKYVPNTIVEGEKNGI